MPFYFGGTSLPIIVVVVMDFMAQVQAHIMSYQYESLLKKTSIRGGGLGCVNWGEYESRCISKENVSQLQNCAQERVVRVICKEKRAKNKVND